MEYLDPRYPGVTFHIEVEQDDQEVRGNVMASGDASADRQAEDEVLARLDAGDVWAWAYVRVVAVAETETHAFQGYDSLGGCTYADESDFVQPGGYFEDMKTEAVHRLALVLLDAVDGGREAARLLDTLTPSRARHEQRSTRALADAYDRQLAAEQAASTPTYVCCECGIRKPAYAMAQLASEHDPDPDLGWCLDCEERALGAEERGIAVDDSHLGF